MKILLKTILWIVGVIGLFSMLCVDTEGWCFTILFALCFALWTFFYFFYMNHYNKGWLDE